MRRSLEKGIQLDSNLNQLFLLSVKSLSLLSKPNLKLTISQKNLYLNLNRLQKKPRDLLLNSGVHQPPLSKMKYKSSTRRKSKSTRSSRKYPKLKLNISLLLSKTWLTLARTTINLKKLLRIQVTCTIQKLGDQEEMLSRSYLTR